MKRNPVVPFVVIMVLGMGLMFALSLIGLGDAKEVAEEQKKGVKQEQVTDHASVAPETLYKQSCIGCHGDAYQGGVGPTLTGVGDRLSAAEIKNVVLNGRNQMPGGLVKEDQAEALVKFLQKIK